MPQITVHTERQLTMTTTVTSPSATYLVEQSPLSFTHTDLTQQAAVLTSHTVVERYVATRMTGDLRSDFVIEICWLPSERRAALAAGADADWTDADSPADALERYLGVNNKEMQN